MKISDIKYKANSLLSNDDKLFKTIIYVGLLSVIFQILKEFTGSFISIIITFLTLTIGHGNIVVSLKTVNNCQEEINPTQDSLVGITKIKKLFPTYFLYQLFLTLIVVIIGLLSGLLVLQMIGDQGVETLQALIITLSTGVEITSEQIELMAQIFGSASYVILLALLLIFFLAIIYTLKFSLYPYIIEKYDIRGLKALKESNRLMKGNMWTLFKLELSFFGWMILASLLVSLFSGALATFIPVSLLVSIISAIFAVFVETAVYNLKLNVCLAVFYEELDYYDKLVDDSINGGV